MFAIIVHDVIGGNESRNVTSCFLRKIRIDLPIIPASSCASDGFVHIGRPAVVSRNDQSPVAENLIEVLQVMCGGIRGLDGVTTFVYQTIDIEAIYLPVEIMNCHNPAAPTREVAPGLRADSMTGRYFSSRGSW